MSTGREREVVEAFVSISGSLARGHDSVDMLATLTGECARLLNIEAAGLLLADGLGVLHVLAASSELTRRLEVFQLQRDQGPCLDCFHSGAPVSVPDLAAAENRWPAFVQAALASEFRSVHALPLRIRDQILGALGLFGPAVGSLTSDDLRLGQALADVASVALFQDNVATDRSTVIEQLQQALATRVLIEQAKGAIAQRGSIDMEAAFTVLRTYARDHNRRIRDVAQAIVDRRLPAQSLLNHATARGM